LKRWKRVPNVLGYRVIGAIHKEDYVTLVADAEALVEQEATICLLLDLENFKSEEISAWGADLKFGREFRKQIDKMAIVGDKRWQKLMAALADPFYAREAKYFHGDKREVAWAWLRAEQGIRSSR